VHDLNGGIPPSGLFWTVPLDNGALRVSADRRRAVLRVSDLPVLESFQFGNPNAVPALTSFSVEWRATGRPVARGSGRGVPPTDPAAFLGSFATASSRASFTAREFGFRFRTNGAATTDRTFAELGQERNGVFL
jgi:hypothetical protein